MEWRVGPDPEVLALFQSLLQELQWLRTSRRTLETRAQRYQEERDHYRGLCLAVHPGSSIIPAERTLADITALVLHVGFRCHGPETGPRIQWPGGVETRCSARATHALLPTDPALQTALTVRAYACEEHLEMETLRFQKMLHALVTGGVGEDPRMDGAYRTLEVPVLPEVLRWWPTVVWQCKKAEAWSSE